MIRRDRIFYIACGLMTVGIVLAMMELYIALLPLVGAYLLRPTLHALGLARKFADERQIQIFSRSGNVGFLVVMFGATVLAILRMAQGPGVGEAKDFGRCADLRSDSCIRPSRVNGGIQNWDSVVCAVYHY